MPATTQPLSEEISVVEIEIPVQVMQKSRPVTGLTAADFEVLDNGVPQELASFRVIDVTESSQPQAVAPVAESPAAQRHLVLLFDLTFSGPFEMVRALDGAREMATGQLRPSDMVATATFQHPRGIRFFHGFTSDRRQLNAALDVLEAILDRDPGVIRKRLAKLRTLREESGPSTGPTVNVSRPEGPVTPAGVPPPARVPSIVDSAAPAPPQPAAVDPLSKIVVTDPAQLEQQAQNAMTASIVRALSRSLAGLAESLRDVGGVRHMLYFSRGFSSELLEPGKAYTPTVLNALRPMRQAFARYGWSLQSIDLAGIPAAADKTHNNLALFYLANETGGELLQYYNDFAVATAKVLERTRVTYFLTIQPQDLVADGRYHRLRVRLRGEPRDARVVHRPGYFAPKPASAPSG